ncbi:hypothetical protein EAI_11261, partial [Harpegnathos saltator]
PQAPCSPHMAPCDFYLPVPPTEKNHFADSVSNHEDMKEKSLRELKPIPRLPRCMSD